MFIAESTGCTTVSYFEYVGSIIFILSLVAFNPEESIEPK
jgi:hypothetical protein